MGYQAAIDASGERFIEILFPRMKRNQLPKMLIGGLPDLLAALPSYLSAIHKRKLHAEHLTHTRKCVQNQFSTDQCGDFKKRAHLLVDGQRTREQHRRGRLGTKDSRLENF